MKIKYIKYISLKKANPRIKAIYKQIKRDFGILAEPFTLHSAIPDLLATVWAVTREICLINKNVPRPYIETISTAISYNNSCKYCIDAHTIMLLTLKNKSVSEAIKTGNLEQIKDTKLQQICRWVLANNDFNTNIIKCPPFTLDEAPEIVGTAFVFNYINRVVEIFLKKSPVSEKQFGKSLLLKIATFIFSKSVKTKKKAGESLQFINQEVTDDPDFKWAKPNKIILKTLSALKATCNIEVDKYISSQTKQKIIEIAKTNNRDNVQLSSNWTNRFKKDFSKEEFSLAKLMLLTMFAPYQITEKNISDLQTNNISDEAILAVTSFASLTIAINISNKQF